MKDILFRGKREDNGEWVYGNLFIPDATTRKAPTEILVGTNIIRISYCVIPETVGQYTGLTDSEGNKIFEGDIIRYEDKLIYNCYIEQLENKELQDDYEEGAFDDLFHYSEVVYALKYGYPAFDLCEHDFGSNGLQELHESGDWVYVVVGNIHDNRDLLITMRAANRYGR